jgi:hypothetical protein
MMIGPSPLKDPMMLQMQKMCHPFRRLTSYGK